MQYFFGVGSVLAIFIDCGISFQILAVLMQKLFSPIFVLLESSNCLMEVGLSSLSVEFEAQYLLLSSLIG